MEGNNFGQSSSSSLLKNHVASSSVPKSKKTSKLTFVVQVLTHGCAFNLLRLETLAITVSKEQIFEKLNSPDTYRRAPVS